MRLHPRKEAGIVVDFVPKGATHNERVVSLHSLLDADFYREGARVTPAPRRRSQRRARRRLTPAPWLVPVTPDVRRRIGVIQREWQRIDPKYLDEDEQRYWATIAGRQIRFDERAVLRPEADRPEREQGRARAVPDDGRGREPEPAAADDGAAGPRLDARRARRLRRSRHARDAGADVGEGAAARDPHPPARDRRGEAGRAGADPRPLDVAARARDAQGAGPARVGGVSGGEAAARRARELARPPARGERGEARARRRSSCRCRSARRCSPRRRATRRARRSSSTRRASSSARSRRSRSRSRRTSPRRSRAQAAAGGAAGAGARAAGARPPDAKAARLGEAERSEAEQRRRPKPQPPRRQPTRPAHFGEAPRLRRSLTPTERAARLQRETRRSQSNG